MDSNERPLDIYEWSTPNGDLMNGDTGKPSVSEGEQRASRSSSIDDEIEAFLNRPRANFSRLGRAKQLSMGETGLPSHFYDIRFDNIFSLQRRSSSSVWSRLRKLLLELPLFWNVKSQRSHLLLSRSVV